MTQLAAVSLFDGIGGFPRAFSLAGIPTVATCEIDKQAAGVTAEHFPDATHFNDATEVTADDLREALTAAGLDPELVAVIVAAGWPCTDISVAGLRLGLGGARSGLVGEVFRLLDELRPRWFILENTVGLLSTVCPCLGENRCGGGCTAAHTVRGGACGPGRCMEIHGGGMGTVLRELGNRGYGFAYRVLDSSGFGVAQRRRRVVIVGCLGDWAAPAEVLLDPQGRGGNPSPRRRSQEVVAALTRSSVGGSGGPDDNAAQAGHLIPWQCHGSNVGPMGTLRRGSGSVSGGVPFVLSQHGSGKAVGINQSPTLRTGTGGSVANLISETQVRRLTPLEYERLFGYPDGWTATSNGKPQSDAARYRELGNTIAVPVFEWVARRIAAYEAKHDREGS